MNWSARHVRVCEMPGAEFVLRRTLSTLCSADKAREYMTEHAGKRFIVIFHDPRLEDDFTVFGTDDIGEVMQLFGMLSHTARLDGLYLSCDVEGGTEIFFRLNQMKETIDIPGGIKAAAAALESDKYDA
jgi:hypothetical protein